MYLISVPAFLELEKLRPHQELQRAGVLTQRTWRSTTGACSS